jgi:replicative DNA helicase
MRLPPTDEGLERAVLGACLVDEAAIFRALEHIQGEAFVSHPYHRRIWDAVLSLHEAQQPVELQGLRSALHDDAVWLHALDLVNDTATTVGVGHHAERLAVLAQRRAALAVCELAAANLCDPDCPGDPVADLLGAALAVQAQAATKAEEASVIVERVYQRIEETFRSRSPYSRSALVTGVYDLDRILFVRPSDYIVLAARPSAGKTALGLQVIDAAAQRGHVYFASLEMSRDAIIQRLLAQRTGISSYRQNQASFLSASDLEELEVATGHVAGLSLWVDDRPSMTVAQIFSSAQVQQARYGLSLVVVDHMSLIRPANPKASMYEAMTQVSKDLKGMARRLGVPVLALAQLSRDVEKSERKPRNSDLRDSGSVEQDADIIVMLHRPDRTGTLSSTELHVTKNRDGQLGEVALMFEAEKQRFTSVTRAGVL